MPTVIRMNCCDRPELTNLVDWGHARSFDLTHGTCKGCGAQWLNVFCVATAITGYEPVSDRDVQAVRSATPGPDRKNLLKAWVDEHL